MYERPPVKSTPRFGPPCTNIKMKPSRITAVEKTYAFLRWLITSKLKFLNRFLEIPVAKLMLRPSSLANHSTNKRETKTAVKNEVAIPNINVVAKPFTGPDPK